MHVFSVVHFHACCTRRTAHEAKKSGQPFKRKLQQRIEEARATRLCGQRPYGPFHLGTPLVIASPETARASQMGRSVKRTGTLMRIPCAHKVP